MRDETRLSISLFCAKMSNKVPTYSLSHPFVSAVSWSVPSAWSSCDLSPQPHGNWRFDVLDPKTIPHLNHSFARTTSSSSCIVFSSISTIFFCRKIPLGRNTATDAGCTATKVMVEWTWRKCTTLLRNTKWLAKFSLLSRLWMGDIVMC